MSYEKYDTETLIELYVSNENVIRDKRSTDLTSMQQQKKIGKELTDRNVTEQQIEQKMQEKGLS